MGGDVRETDGNLDGQLLKQPGVHSRAIAQPGEIRLIETADDLAVQTDGRDGKGADEVHLTQGKHGIVRPQIPVKEQRRRREQRKRFQDVMRRLTDLAEKEKEKQRERG